MAAQGQDASDISAAEAFIPDFHLRRDLRSPEGMAKALQAATQEMAQLFKRIWSENTDLRTYHALGNHEVAGLTNPTFRGKIACAGRSS